MQLQITILSSVVLKLNIAFGMWYSTTKIFTILNNWLYQVFFLLLFYYLPSPRMIRKFASCHGIYRFICAGFVACRKTCGRFARWGGGNRITFFSILCIVWMYYVNVHIHIMYKNFKLYYNVYLCRKPINYPRNSKLYPTTYIYSFIIFTKKG